MQEPKPTDRVVRARAYLTDQGFGYDHWRAAQFGAPRPARAAVVVMFDSDEQQRAFEAEMRARFCDRAQVR